MAEAEVIFHKATPVPVVWQVTCPVCGHGVDVMMNEGDDGLTYTSGDWFGDPFVTCEGCEAVIEPVPVQVQAKTADSK